MDSGRINSLFKVDLMGGIRSTKKVYPIFRCWPNNGSRIGNEYEDNY
jgi:hypothetical protein